MKFSHESGSRQPLRSISRSSMTFLLAVIFTAVTAFAAAPQNYIVLYKAKGVPSSASSSIKQAGGTIIASYGPIGVVIARSSSDTFSQLLVSDSKVESVIATNHYATHLDSGETSTENEVPVTNTPAVGSDSLSGLQWDMVQIQAIEARAITGGSSTVTTGVIDTGLDYTHPDLAANVDFANSVSCISGAPVTTPAAWFDDNGHGTHVAGIIGAALNGIGIVGVAPNTRIAGIKAGNAAGFFYPEAVVCSFMWAATHKIQVANNSYFVDPYLFNCANDPAQRAIWKAVRRSVTYAIQRGVTVVSNLGNTADDLAHPTQDASSPDDTIPTLRDITNACRVIPVEVSGVIGVTANGNLGFKSYYSSFGVGTTQVVAPGGDSNLQLTSAAPNGRVLSTWPATLINNCPAARRVVDGSGATYCYQQGTSFAAPHVSGVAALIVSTGISSPGAVAAQINNTADATPCPSDVSIYSFFPSTNSGLPQACIGGFGYNSFHGHGQVNALSAVTQ
jgi:lantibiotic leader peptide-processing serine protease